MRTIDLYVKKKGISLPKVNSFSRIIKYRVKYMKTGMEYGCMQVENNILQALITNYYRAPKQLMKDAEVWYKVLH